MEKSDVNKYVCSGEKIYFAIMLFFSLFFYLILILSIIGIIYFLMIALCVYITQLISVADIKRNSVKITDEQFPDIYKKVEEYSKILEMKEVPEIYLMQSGGLLNAFATKFLFKDVLVLYSDILELAIEKEDNALDFIIAHELAHVKRKHLSKMKYIICACIVPFLYFAYSRTCELTCDSIAYALTGFNSPDGLLVLAAGKKLYKNINLDVYLKNSAKDNGITAIIAEYFSTHPSLATRIAHLIKLKNEHSIELAAAGCENDSFDKFR